MWSHHQSVLYFLPDEFKKPKGKMKIGIFDLDGTLITSPSGRRFATQDPDDWIFLGPIPEYLNLLHQDGYLIVIMTNQSALKKRTLPRINKILDELQKVNGWQPLVFISTEKDEYRKPNPGMVELLYQLLGTKEVERIFVSGDAVGPDDPYPPYQWGSFDKGLAEKIGAEFFRAEDIFGHSLPQPAPYQELVLTVGNQGSGKTSTTLRFKESGYHECISDLLKTEKKLIQCAEEGLSKGESVIIDATNAKKEKREKFLELASKFQVPTRILWHIRDGRPFNALREKPVPEIAYSVYMKNFERPTEDEGVVEIVY